MRGNTDRWTQIPRGATFLEGDLFGWDRSGSSLVEVTTRPARSLAWPIPVWLRRLPYLKRLRGSALGSARYGTSRRSLGGAPGELLGAGRSAATSPSGGAGFDRLSRFVQIDERREFTPFGTFGIGGSSERAGLPFGRVVLLVVPGLGYLLGRYTDGAAAVAILPVRAQVVGPRDWRGSTPAFSR